MSEPVSESGSPASLPGSLTGPVTISGDSRSAVGMLWAETRLEIWARATLDLESPDLRRGHTGRARIGQREIVAAANDVLEVLSELARVRATDG